MNKSLYTSRSYVLLFVSLLLVCCLICSDIASRNISDNNKYKNDNIASRFLNINIDDQLIQITDHSFVPQSEINYSNIILESTLDIELEKKYLNKYPDNSKFFETFITNMISAMFLVFRSKKRVVFETIHFKQSVTVMDYIHQMDGESEKLTKSFIYAM